jgi:hypothetical protein
MRPAAKAMLSARAMEQALPVINSAAADRVFDERWEVNWPDVKCL